MYKGLASAARAEALSLNMLDCSRDFSVACPEGEPKRCEYVFFMGSCGVMPTQVGLMWAMGPRAWREAFVKSALTTWIAVSCAVTLAMM